MLLSYVVFFALSTLTIASPVAQDSNDPNPDEMLAELSDSSLLDDLNATIVAECSPQSGTTQDNGNIQRRTGTCKPTKEQQTGQTNGGQQLAPETPATRSDNICEGTERPIFLKCNGPVVGGKPDDHIVDLVLHCGPVPFYRADLALFCCSKYSSHPSLYAGGNCLKITPDVHLPMITYWQYLKTVARDPSDLPKFDYNPPRRQ